MQEVYACMSGHPTWGKKLEAQSGIEPPMRVLQTHALPLGYRAIRSFTATTMPQNEKPTCQVFRRWAAISRG